MKTANDLDEIPRPKPGLLICLAAIFCCICPVMCLRNMGDPVGELIVSTKEVRRVTNPNKRYDAVVLAVDAGATTSTAYHVNIVDHGKQVVYANERTRALVADKLRTTDLETKWTSDTSLVVRLVKGRVFRKERRVGPITVTYEFSKQVSE